MKMAEIEKRLYDGNSRFAETNADYRPLASGQRPNVTIIACSDSRVAPETVHSARLGEIFAIRTAGQAMDEAALASIEYSVAHLGIESVIIEGHTGCGAVTAALEALGGKVPKEAALFRLVKGLASDLSRDDDLDTAVWKNARARARELLRRSGCIASAVREHKVELGVAVYDISTGRVSGIERIER